MRNLLDWNQKTIPAKNLKDRFIRFSLALAVFSATAAFSTLAHASVESSLAAVQSKLVGTLLPLAAMCGLVIAGISFVAGHANARQHLIYAIVGAIVGFGSESIVSFIRNLIH
jgi:type IV secretory pathway VirB2 component (pilin)